MVTVAHKQDARALLPAAEASHGVQVIWWAIPIPDHGFQPTGYTTADHRLGLQLYVYKFYSCHTGYAMGGHHLGSRLYALKVLSVAHDGTHGFVSHRLYDG
jgi:hypothetical protein